MDDEEDNPKIKRLIERQRAIYAEAAAKNEARKVITLKGREVFVSVPVEAPQEPTEGLQEPKVDQDTIDLLTETLERAKKGVIWGCIILSGLPTSHDPELVTDICAGMTYSAAENIQIFLGGIETAKIDLLKFHEDIEDVEEYDEVMDEED